MEVLVAHARSIATMLAALLGFYGIYVMFKPSNDQYLNQIPWVGRRVEWFASVRAKLRSVKQMFAMAFEGYNKFSKHGKAFAIPSLQMGPIVMLPLNKIHDHLIQPDSILDHKSAQDAFIHSEYTVSHDRIMKNAITFDIIRRQLTRRLPFVIQSLYEELGLAFDEIWGKDTENWSEFSAMKTCMKIVSRTSNRIFIGAPLCRNEEFLQSCELYTQGIFAAAALIDQIPIWLRPLIGPLVAAPNKKHINVAMRHAKPIIEERLRHVELKMKDQNYAWEAPEDYLQWQIDESYERNDPDEREPEIVVRRLMMLNMVAIHTSTLTVANAILDLWSSDPSDAFVEGLREECSRIFTDDGKWTKSGVDRMVRTDSAIKESMRLSTIVLTSMPRRVAALEGVSLGHGLHIPHGALVCFPMDPIHRDPDIYPNPDVYDAFRFSRNREMFSSKSQCEVNDVQLALKLKKQTMATVGDHFLAFGHGRHACLGRFFASTLIKLMLSYIVAHYDICYVNERVENIKIFSFSFPPSSATITARRRVT